MRDNGQLDFLDILSIMSFYIGVLNLELNITQSDLEAKTEDIHNHLEEQDRKLSEIIEKLEVLTNDS